MKTSRLPAWWLLLALIALPVVAEDEAPQAAGQRSAEALEILEKVDTTVKGISAVRYKVKIEPGGVAEQRMSPGEGSALMVGWNGQVPEKFFVEAKTTRAGEPVSVTGGGNGDIYFLIDHTHKKAYEDMDPGVMGGSGQVLFGFAMVEFVHDRPFDDELNAEVVELLGTEVIGGDECHKIRVVYAGGGGESLWYFSTADYTPRGRVQVLTTPQGAGTIRRTIYDVEIDPEIDDKMFVMKLPDGYEQIDDFAP